jgi:tetratricopeptide (TPR) repeat protein
MSSEGRAEVEAKAERYLRRGEMSEALALYQTLLEQHPEDEALQRKVAHIQETLQPHELQAARAPTRPEPTESHLHPSGPEQEGERLFALGDYVGAAAAYRRALNERPGSELIQERLLELYRLAKAAPRHSPTDSALPRDREGLLRALLDRISARRRLLLG